LDRFLGFLDQLLRLRKAASVFILKYPGTVF
jgi:hypothetical protein